MVHLRCLVACAATTALVSSVVAHPGDSEEHIRREIADHKAASIKARESLEACANSPHALALRARAIERRAATAQALREERGISHKSMRSKRDDAALDKWAQVSHDLTDKSGYTLETSFKDLFSSNSTCALVPETTIGPYFVTGEMIRKDITEGAKGVPVHLDLQFVDISTCAAVPDMLIDVWQTNATGVYSGVSAEGQGGLTTTFLRGVQPTDRDGVAQFDTIFPGHYPGRTPHIHVLSSEKATVLPNDTYTGGTANHIGQLFFEQGLIETVAKVSPYSTNTQPLTSNKDDGIAAAGASDKYDPFVDYVMLGGKLEDGLLVFIVIGVDVSADRSSDYYAAAHRVQGGGVNADGSGGEISSAVSSATGSITGAPTGSPSRTAAAPVSSTSAAGASRMRRILFW